jgi:hypothetical protein
MRRRRVRWREGLDLPKLKSTMPQLTWNETDVLSCLEVAPEAGEYEVSYHYQVFRLGLRLDLGIYPFASDVYLSLFREGVENPIFEMKMIGCSGIRYIHDERGEYLEFAPAKVFGTRYDGCSPIPYGVRLSVNPCLSIRFF